jgi:hypothetical protein
VTASISLYKQAVDISEEYLGPAAERFIRRQISTHLNIKPEKLNHKDIPKLVKWVSLAFALLSNNVDDHDEYTQSLLRLKSGNKKR